MNYVAGQSVIFHRVELDSAGYERSRLSRLFPTLQNANWTKNPLATTCRKTADFLEMEAKKRFPAQCRRWQIFDFSSDLHFEGWEIILKVFPFLPSNPLFNTVQSLIAFVKGRKLESYRREISLSLIANTHEPRSTEYD